MHSEKAERCSRKVGARHRKAGGRSGERGAEEIDEADFAMVLVRDRIALAPIAQQAVDAVVQMGVAARTTRAGSCGGRGIGGEKIEFAVRGGVARTRTTPFSPSICHKFQAMT